MRSKKALKKMNDERLHALVNQVRTDVDGLLRASVAESFWSRHGGIVRFHVRLQYTDSSAIGRYDETRSREFTGTFEEVRSGAIALVLQRLREAADVATRVAEKAKRDAATAQARAEAYAAKKQEEADVAVAAIEAFKANVCPRAGDVYRHRLDGDLCRVTETNFGTWSTNATDMHDGAYGSFSDRELAQWWERIARDVSDEAFRAMRCTCARCTTS